ncbi:MAG: hypothetical protein A3J28_02495 [Acidobacteria bacterium RIFCSPLOWO2_12_FULL_60_22]|nr:MAG: hypothetical protein A3J28_02495 [Acidobacteria bacterium RIFCSPLOWO2_12_FULL_60_22]
MSKESNTAIARNDPVLLPDSPRVIYGKNPLVQVICQLRFPPILRIDAEPPAAFQDRIRRDYPLLQEKPVEELIDFPSDIPRNVVNLLRMATKQRSVKAYDFRSEDGNWIVSLTRDFLALTNTNYERWENFRNHLDSPIEALLEVYQPAYFTRIGLRYQDLIQRSKLGLDGRVWGQLLKQHIAGIFCASDLKGTVQEVYSETVLQFPDSSWRSRLRHGLALSPDKEECYLIDSDFFTEEKVDTNHAMEILNCFNRQSGKLFRWCISETLHEAMDPRPIEPAV